MCLWADTGLRHLNREGCGLRGIGLMVRGAIYGCQDAGMLLSHVETDIIMDMGKGRVKGMEMGMDMDTGMAIVNSMPYNCRNFFVKILINDPHNVRIIFLQKCIFPNGITVVLRSR